MVENEKWSRHAASAFSEQWTPDGQTTNKQYVYCDVSNNYYTLIVTILIIIVNPNRLGCRCHCRR